jgi:hypothetical protein
MNTNSSEVTTTTTNSNTKTYSGKQVLGIAAGGMLAGAALSAGYRWVRGKFAAAPAAAPTAPAAGPAPTTP